MLKFSQYIAEAFDKPYKVTLKKEASDMYMSKVKLPDGSDLVILFTSVEFDDDPLWNIVFDRNGSTDVTGEGDQMRVFATVLDATKKFIKKEKPAQVRFSASKEKGVSRTNLYKRLINRFADSLGYKVSEISSDKDDDVFYLEKK